MGVRQFQATFCEFDLLYAVSAILKAKSHPIPAMVHYGGGNIQGRYGGQNSMTKVVQSPIG